MDPPSVEAKDGSKVLGNDEAASIPSSSLTVITVFTRTLFYVLPNIK